MDAIQNNAQLHGMKTIQQRRPFFQAVTNENSLQRILKCVVSRFRYCRRIAATFAVLLLISCTSLTPDRVNLLAAIAGQAAQIGAQEWLAKHPDHRAAFGLVIDELQRLLKAGETNQAQYATNLNSLPTATLAGPSGELYVTEDRLVVWDAELKKAVAVEGKAEQPVIRATVAGLKRAMLPLPPMPVASRAGRTLPRVTANRVTFPVFTPTVALTNVAATVPVQLSPEPDAAPPLQLSRTNVTRSVVDVTHNEGAASMVSVRWVLGPNSVYHVERMEGDAWCRFASLTNTSATGPTNCVMTWPASLPAGSWRVLRVRN